MQQNALISSGVEALCEFLVNGICMNKGPKTICFKSLNGAGGGGRTHTVSLPRDFESRASANSTTPANQFKVL